MAGTLAALRARIGATVLDVIRPGWAAEINLKKLDLANCEVCVLGQLYGSYEAGAATLFAMTADYENAACRAGFNTTDRDLPSLRYPALTAAWRAEIRRRRRCDDDDHR